MGIFRQDPITKEWTIISPGRKTRPGETGLPGLKKRAKIDPFGPGKEKETPPEVFRLGPGKPDTPGWEVRVFPNKYPVCDDHEIVVHSPDPYKDIENLPFKQIEKILSVYLNRFLFYDKKGYTHIFCNHGRDSGASLTHPHSQLVVLKYIPEAILEELWGAQRYFQEFGKEPFGQEIKKARANKKRLVFENNSFVVITPYASEWPYEVMIFPNQSEASFANISAAEVKDLAVALKKVLEALTALFWEGKADKFSYNFWLHSSNSFVQSKYPGGAVEKFYRWHFEIIPRIKKLGGIELGAGVMVVDRETPEVAARQLRREIQSNHFSSTLAPAASSFCL